MFDIYIYYNNFENASTLKKICSTFLMNSNSDCDIFCVNSLEELKSMVTSNVALYFVEDYSHLELTAEIIHNRNLLNYIVIVLENHLDLITVIKPNVRPSGVLVKPIQKESINQILTDTSRDLEKFSKKDYTNVYKFKIKSKEYVIPMDDIVYFETRDKKTYLNTLSNEFGFYEPLDEVFSKLPQNFLKVHRSFIVNLDKVVSVDYHSNIITLNSEQIVPFARNYKSIIKEKLSERNSA